MNKKKILVLTASHLCRNPRVVKEATTLGLAGYDVTVMTVTSSERFEQIDQTLLTGASFRRLTLDYASSTAKARVGSFIQRSATWVSRLLCRRLGLQLPQSLGASRALLNFARPFRADLTIVHTEIPIWAAQYLVKAGHRIAVDVEDWYSEDLLFADRQSRPIRLLRRAESFALNRCVYSSATSESMADALCSAYNCPRPVVLRNTFPLQARSRINLKRQPPALIWFSQTIGPGRGLELFLAAWAKTRVKSHVYLLGDERTSYRQQLLGRVPLAKRDDIFFIPTVTPEQLPVKLAEFDIGLALEPRLPLNRDITITNKLFQYLNAGLAVIATDTAGQTEVFQQAPSIGLLIQAHETTAIAVKLDELLGDHDRLIACQRAARRSAENTFSWEQDEPRLLAAMERALHPQVASSR